MEQTELQGQILNKLLSLTESKKVAWTPKSAIAFHTNAGSGVSAEITLRSQSPMSGWENIRVYDRNETVVTVNNPSNVLGQALLPTSIQQLIATADQIFDVAVMQPAREKMRHALDVLNSLS
jgi:hypothetical protein